jgi:hypothetical protein
MYVDYAYYLTTGGTIPEEKFDTAEAQAEACIGYLTYVRGDIFATEDDRVKRAVCAASDVIYQTTSEGGTAVKSESNDGYSVTYVAEATDGQTTEELLRKKVFEAVRMYLLPTGWLDRRVKMGGSCYDHADCDCHL